MSQTLKYAGITGAALAFFFAAAARVPTDQTQIQSDQNTPIESTSTHLQDIVEPTPDLNNEKIPTDDAESTSTEPDISSTNKKIVVPAEFKPDTPAPIINSPAPNNPPIVEPVIETPKPVTSCSCPTVDLDCGDFNGHYDAQAVYDCCMDQYGYDKHRLDRDSDGLACEAS